MTTDPLTILSEQKRFYQDLYRTKTEAVEINSSTNEFLNKLGIPKLSEEQKQTCEGKISIQECEKVLDSFQTNKSPGIDGIPVEFYKHCWNIIRQPFLESVNESFENGDQKKNAYYVTVSIYRTRQNSPTSQYVLFNKLSNIGPPPRRCPTARYMCLHVYKKDWYLADVQRRGTCVNI